MVVCGVVVCGGVVGCIVVASATSSVRVGVVGGVSSFMLSLLATEVISVFWVSVGVSMVVNEMF